MGNLLVARINRHGEIGWIRGNNTNCILKELHFKRSDLFTEKNHKLFVKNSEETKDVCLLALLDSALKIAGTNYAFVLDLFDGNKDHSDFSKLYENVQNRTFRMRQSYWESTLTRYIKQNAECVGELRDGHVLWVDDIYYLNVSIKTIQETFSRDLSMFEILDNKIYYLQKKTIIAEGLFFKCLELAGDERTLAKELAKPFMDQKDLYNKEVMKHYNAFTRFSFSSNKTFKRYINFFVKYLNNPGYYTPSLFGVEE